MQGEAERGCVGAAYVDPARTSGNKGRVDMVTLIRLYLTTCAVINAFEVPTPETMTR